MMQINVARRRRYRRSHWPAVVIVIATALIIAGIVSLAVYQSQSLVVKLNGEEKITLEYGEEYTEEGALAFFGNVETEAELEITGQVNPRQLGIYTITYTVRQGNITAAAERTVEIVDTRAPVITLDYMADAFTEPGAEYEEEGYSAWDEVDGDLTAAVQRTVADGVVTYTVADSSGNSTRVERSIVYDDRTAPELVLLGDETVHITAGTKFEEPGYTATDNVDGDVTVNVIVNGEFAIDVPGSYTIHYTVTDNHGNTAEADRNLIVNPTEPPQTQPPETQPEPAQKPNKDTDDETDYSDVDLKNDPENPGEKVIYLTFDDGPGAYTLELLEILEKYNVKVTFFVVGTACLEYLDEIAEAGHSIGLHTNTHVYSDIYASKKAFFSDLQAVSDKVYERTGIESKLHRFPGGSSNTLSRKYCKGIMSDLVVEVEEAGYTYFDWNVDSDDAGSARTAEQVYKNVITGVKNRKTAVVLQHDIKKYSVDAVEKIIQWGLDNGYTFLPLTEDSPAAHHSVNN